jgi:predicted transcriptional regulator of viral defense system
MSDTPSARARGITLLQEVLATAGPIFTIEQARAAGEALDLSADQVRILLSRLARGRWLARIKRGVYAAQSPLLGAEIHPFAVAAALVEPMAISHWSALAHHGLTTQVPTMVQASTPRAIVAPDVRGGSTYRPRGRTVWRALDTEFEFIVVRPSYFFGLQAEWVSQWHRVNITDPERTLLEMVAHPRIFGGIRVAIETMEAHLGQFDPGKLVAYALRYDVGAVIKRLGWILDALGVPDAELELLKSYPVSNDNLLDAAGPRAGATIREWRIKNNL